MEEQNTARLEPDDKLDIRNDCAERYRRISCAWSRSKTEPAYKVELVEERKRREQLERRLNELVDENRRSRQMAEEMERIVASASELQRLGVDEGRPGFQGREGRHPYGPEDGRLVAKTDTGEVGDERLPDRLRQ